MDKTIRPWIFQEGPFCGMTMGLKAENNFTFSSRVKLNNGKTTIGGVYSLGFPQEEEEKQGMIEPKSIFYIEHPLSERINIHFSNISFI